MENTTLDLVYNLLCDLKKKELDKFTRAKLIQEYIDSKAISIRQLAKLTGIPKSTIEDWLRWNNISPQQYNDYQKQGFTHTDIYESLREGSLSDRELAIDKTLKRCVSLLVMYKIKPPYSSDTKVLIDKLRRVLKIIEGQIK